MMSKHEMWEGLGGPVRLDRPASSHGREVDPTLDACCRRELESNRTFSALQRTLNRHDVVAIKERRRKHLIPNHSFGNVGGCRCCYDPNSDGGEYRALVEARAMRRQQDNEEDEEGSPEEKDETDEQEVIKSDDDDSDDEFDYLLDEDLPGGDDSGGVLYEHEESRRAELEFAMLQQEVALQHGYGVHRQMHPNRVLRAAGLGGTPSSWSPPPQAVVLHLVDPDSMASASLDLYLEQLAETYKGTKFLRSGGRSVLLMDAELSQRALPRLNPNSDMPALVAIRDGVAIAACPRLQGLLSDESDDAVVFPDEVRAWLDKAGVLLERPPPFDELCMIRPEEEALMDQLAASAPQVQTAIAGARYDCGVPMCDKAFPHEHVGVQNEQQDGLVVQEEEIVGKGSV